MTNVDHKLSKTFILSKYYMLWLSYECFSILWWCFFAKKGHFHPQMSLIDLEFFLILNNIKFDFFSIKCPLADFHKQEH